MDMGRAILGTSAAAALVLAAGFGVVVGQGNPLTTDVRGGGACGNYPEGSRTAAAWFLATFDNKTDHGVRVRDVSAPDVHRVTLSGLAIAPHPSDDASGLIVTDDPTMPADFGRTVPVDSGYVVPPHGHLNVVGHIELHDGADAGRVHGLIATSTGLLGAVHTVTNPVSFGVGIGSGHDQRDIGCTGT